MYIVFFFLRFQQLNNEIAEIGVCEPHIFPLNNALRQKLISFVDHQKKNEGTSEKAGAPSGGVLSPATLSKAIAQVPTESTAASSSASLPGGYTQAGGVIYKHVERFCHCTKWHIIIRYHSYQLRCEPSVRNISM